MLRDATPDLNLYAKRVAEWLAVEFETSTEQALDQIFTQFETSLFIPFADPIRYLRGRVEQRSLLRNQRRFFLQRAESSMYALRRTIKNFGDRIRKMQQQLEAVSPDAYGLKEFLLLHYGFESEKKKVVADPQPVRIETGLAFKLRSMGLIIFQSNDVIPSCELYRQYFGSILA